MKEFKTFLQGTQIFLNFDGWITVSKNRFTHSPKINSKLKPGVFFSYFQLKKLYEESQQEIKKLEVEVSVDKSIFFFSNSLQLNESVTFFIMLSGILSGNKLIKWYPTCKDNISTYEDNILITLLSSLTCT